MRGFSVEGTTLRGGGGPFKGKKEVEAQYSKEAWGNEHIDREQVAHFDPPN